MQNNMGNNLKKTKLSTKIYFGFSAVIAIAIALGGIAIWNLLKIKVNADNLANDYMPEVTVANNVERNSLHTMYANRGYVYTEEKQFLNTEKEALIKVKEEVAKAIELGKSSSNLKGLLEAAQKADAGVKEYEKEFLLVEATIISCRQIGL
jgi:methyl-accepting chemotaxis protein